MNFSDLMIAVGIAVFSPLFTLGLSHKLSERSRRKNALVSLLEETECNLAYLMTPTQNVILYEDSYMMTKNSGDIRLLKQELVHKMRNVYIKIKNRNDILHIPRHEPTMNLAKLFITFADEKKKPFVEYMKLSGEQLKPLLEELKIIEKRTRVRQLGQLF